MTKCALIAFALCLLAYLACAAEAANRTPKYRCFSTWEPCLFGAEHGLPPEPGNRFEQQMLEAGYQVKHRWQDTTLDEACTACTRQNWDDFPNEVGAVGIFAHGTAAGGVGLLEAAYGSQATCDAWGNGDTGITVVQWLDVEDIYVVLVTPNWAEQHWGSNLSSNRAIVFLGACYSAAPADGISWIDHCGGAACFGYASTIDSQHMQFDMIQLLQRMMGKWTAPNKNLRPAENAFNEGGFSPGFRRVGGLVTLAPAPTGAGPQGPTGAHSSGGITLDTYCDTGIAAAEGLTFEVLAGSCSITGVDWDRDEFHRSNNIHFEYTATGDPCNPAFTVRVTAHANKIIADDTAEGQEIQMDGDCVAPNGDDKVWTFYYQAP